MKTLYKSLIVLFSLFFIVAPTVSATEMKSGENVILPADTVIEGNYFTAGDTVTISGTINGDLYVAGGNVTIEGTVNGDILAAGGNINILGTVEQDIRVVGGNITISGSIGQNLTVLGGSVNITDSTDIKGSIVAAGGSIQMFAPVPGSVTVAGGDVSLGSEIAGDVVAAVGSLRVTSNGSIGGDLTYYSEEQLNLPTGATVSGQIMRKDYPDSPKLDKEQKENIVEAGRAAKMMSKIINILSAFVIGILLLKFVPKYTTHVEKRINESPWKSMGVGLVFLIAAPLIALILFVTVIGIPLGFLLFVAYFFSIYLSKIFISLLLGRRLLAYFKSKYNDIIVLGIGLITYLILSSVPFIGWLVVFISVITGIGAIYLGKQDYYKELQAKKVI